MCGGEIIDVFPLHSETDVQPDIAYTTRVEGPFLVEDTVTDSSEGAFRPSVYMLAGGVPIATYNIEHRMLLHEGDTVRINAWRIPNAFLFRLGDAYKDITPGHKSII